MGLAVYCSGSSRADLVENAAETMLEEQGALLGLLGYNFGADPSSPIQFDFSIDSNTGNFSFQSTSPTYLGQSVSVSDVATFNGVDTYSMAGNITLGGNSYTTASTGVLSLQNDGSTQLTLDITLAGLPPKGANDIHLIAVWFLGKSVDLGYFTKDKVKIPKSDFVSTDYIRDGRKHYELIPLFDNQGPFIRTDGDERTFTSTLSPVPEPSSLAVIAVSGLAALAFRASRRGDRASS